MAKLDASEIEHIVQAEIEDAISFLDLEMSPDRAKAVDYYRGKPFGDEQEGQSKVVSTDVRDTVLAIIPSLMRIFFGSENVVEYVPRRPDSVPAAEQATEYVRYIVNEDNQGFLIFHTVFKDALISRNGVIKYGWEEKFEVKTEHLTGIDDAMLAYLQNEAATKNAQGTATQIEITVTSSQPDPMAQLAGPPAQAQMGIPGGPVEQQTPQIHAITVTRREDVSRVKLYSIPPEEFLIGRKDANVEDAGFTAHRSNQTVSDLLSMGFTQDELDSAGTDSSLDFNVEALARSPSSILNLSNSDNPAMKRLMYVEAYMKIDCDGDGIAELRKICCVGDQHKMLRNDPVEEAPFATFGPDPEPHVFFGSSISDKTMDIQRIKSQLWRGILNSLVQSINPRMGVVEGQVNMDDALSNEIGGVIRMRQVGMVMPYTVPFVGQAALPILQLVDDVREARTGVTKASQGLDADVMQSTTKAAVMATVTAAQQQLEMIARIFAETGMKRLFKGILRTICRHQDKPRMIRLRKKFVPMDPSGWDATMDVSVNVGLGSGTNEEKINILAAIAQKQETILQTLGADNPIVSVAQYSHTLRKAAELAGFKDSSLFFSDVPADWKPPAPQGPPPPSPQEKAAQLLAEAQMKEIEASIQKKSAELDLQRQQMFMDDARARYQIEVNERVALSGQEAQFGAQTMKVQADIDRQNRQIQFDENAAMLAAHTKVATTQPPAEPQGPTQ
jgi:hypothetical protein